MQTVTAEWLQSIESLKEVPVEQLQWWLENSEHHEVPEGGYLFKSGEPIAGTYVIVKGRVRMSVQQKNNTRKLGYFEVKDITGFLPFSRGTTSSANGQVEEALQVMTFPVDKMKDLIIQHYELTQALVHIMTSRVRDFTTMQQQNEKMMALGKLSAGLAHELNNPASAIVRGSISLKKHLQLVPDTFKKVIAVRMSPEEVDKVNDKMFAVLARHEKPILTLMQRTNLEDELAECLEGLGVDNSQELAENFIEFGFTCQDMDEFSALIPEAYLSPMLNWINNNLVTEKMVTDIQDASQRIEKLVSAIKNFTHMDRDRDKEYVDIHGGIKNTLTMLGYKLKKNNIKLIEHYDLTLPRINAFVGELNQVWTNLIDNALDALEGVPQGQLEIQTKTVNAFLEVSITDNGPGIPEEIKNRIFDPFFTTKDVGKGTGLGLDVVSRIVQQHDGYVKFNSQPGRTSFCVYFPLNG